MDQIIWTYEDRRWLKEIFLFISKDDPAAASTVIQNIYNQAQILLEQPEIGYLYEHESTQEIRILLYKHYRITYTTNQNKIIILGVFHGALQMEDYLQV